MTDSITTNSHVDMEVAMENKHGVDVWDNWDDLQRSLFNSLYERMLKSPWAFTHPEAVKIPREHWKTTAWNAAWMAADMLGGHFRWIGSKKETVYAVGI